MHIGCFHAAYYSWTTLKMEAEKSSATFMSIHAPVRKFSIPEGWNLSSEARHWLRKVLRSHTFRCHSHYR